MYPYNRRMLINRQYELNSASNQDSNSDSNDIHTSLKNSINAISNNINDIKKTLSQIEKKLDRLEENQALIESIIDKDYSSRASAVNSNLSDIRNELEQLKKESCMAKSQYSSYNSGNRPVMPGSGFAGITEEYLKSLSKNNLP